MFATLHLADYGDDPGNGKVSAIGLGWTVTSAPTPPMCVLALFKVPWTDANRKIKVVIELLDADGRMVPLDDPDALGNRPGLHIAVDLEVGRPPGTPPGSPLAAHLLINMGPLPLEPNKAYEFRMAVDGEHEESWSARFNTRA